MNQIRCYVANRDVVYTMCLSAYMKVELSNICCVYDNVDAIKLAQARDDKRKSLNSLCFTFGCA